MIQLILKKLAYYLFFGKNNEQFVFNSIEININMLSLGIYVNTSTNLALSSPIVV